MKLHKNRIRPNSKLDETIMIKSVFLPFNSIRYRLVMKDFVVEISLLFAKFGSLQFGLRPFISLYQFGI